MNAIKYALEFFKYQETQFLFMHAYQNEFYDHEELTSRDHFDTVLEKVKMESESSLKQLLKDVNALAPNPRFTYDSISANNTLVSETNSLAHARHIDLIVIGTKGISDERQTVFGSQTFQVLKCVECPVLAIPCNYSNTQPKRILFPTNYLMPYKRRELKLLSILAKSYRCKIDILYVSKSDKLSIRQEDNQAFIKNVLSDNELNFCFRDSHHIPHTITNYIKENQMDMLTMVNTQHSFLEDLLFPSTLDKVGLGLDIPLLALQNTTRI